MKTTIPKEKEMNKTDRKVLAILAKAQSFSDSAKGSEKHNSYRRNYEQKDLLIKQALKILEGNRHSSLVWNLIRSKDQNGNDSHVFLIQFRDGGRERQISFHCFGKFHDKGTLSLSWNKKFSESRKVSGKINHKEALKSPR